MADIMNGPPAQSPVREIRAEDLLESAKRMKDEGFRLVQVTCTRTEGYEMTYSFDREYDLRHLRVNLPETLGLCSLSDFYGSAFLYENEIHDLFGVTFIGLKVDYGGKFYKTKTPFPLSGKPEAAGGKANG
jgi:ech hydrogenase subunit D